MALASAARPIGRHGFYLPKLCLRCWCSGARSAYWRIWAWFSFSLEFAVIEHRGDHARGFRGIVAGTVAMIVLFVITAGECEEAPARESRQRVTSRRAATSHILQLRLYLLFCTARLFEQLRARMRQPGCGAALWHHRGNHMPTPPRQLSFAKIRQALVTPPAPCRGGLADQPGVVQIFAQLWRRGWCENQLVAGRLAAGAAASSWPLQPALEQIVGYCTRRET
jgi:hypothetical protein